MFLLVGQMLLLGSSHLTKLAKTNNFTLCHRLFGAKNKQLFIKKCALTQRAMAAQQREDGSWPRTSEPETMAQSSLFLAKDTRTLSRTVKVCRTSVSGHGPECRPPAADQRSAFLWEVCTGTSSCLEEMAAVPAHRPTSTPQHQPKTGRSEPSLPHCTSPSLRFEADQSGEISQKTTLPPPPLHDCWTASVKLLQKTKILKHVNE